MERNLFENIFWQKLDFWSVYVRGNISFPFAMNLTTFDGFCSDAIIQDRCYSGPTTDASMTNTL